MINRNEMSDREINWLNSYHKQVFNLLSPNLQAHEIEWLEKKCAAI